MWLLCVVSLEGGEDDGGEEKYRRLGLEEYVFV